MKKLSTSFTMTTTGLILKILSFTSILFAKPSTTNMRTLCAPLSNSNSATTTFQKISDTLPFAISKTNKTNYRKNKTMNRMDKASAVILDITEHEDEYVKCFVLTVFDVYFKKKHVLTFSYTDYLWKKPEEFKKKTLLRSFALQFTTTAISAEKKLSWANIRPPSPPPLTITRKCSAKVALILKKLKAFS